MKMEILHRGMVFLNRYVRLLPKESGKITTYDFKEDKIKFYKMSLVDDSTGEDYIFDYCIENDVVALGWEAI